MTITKFNTKTSTWLHRTQMNIQYKQIVFSNAQFNTNAWSCIIQNQMQTSLHIQISIPTYSEPIQNRWIPSANNWLKMIQIPLLIANTRSNVSPNSMQAQYIITSSTWSAKTN